MGAGRGAGGRAVSRVTATTVIAASVLVLLGLAGARSTAGAATAETLTFAPAADTFVALGFPGTNYGSAAGLEVDNSPVKHLLLKFTVSGIGGRTVQSAKLRLYAFDPSPSGGALPDCLQLLERVGGHLDERPRGRSLPARDPGRGRCRRLVRGRPLLARQGRRDVQPARHLDRHERGRLHLQGGDGGVRAGGSW